MKTLIYACMFCWWLFYLIPTQAEVVLDGSLGASGALPGPDYLIGSELGQQRGANLFHSFSAFNLTNTESAIFTGPAEINNVISRITGGSPSSIDGIVRSSIESANFYLINPNGLIFGPNVIFDVNGAVHLSSAEQLSFADGTTFPTSFTAEPILTAAAPSAFGFLSDTPAPISFNGSQAGNPSETFSVVGGDITVTGTDTEPALLLVDAGRINAASLSSAGEVTITSDDLIMTAEGGNLTVDSGWLFARDGGNVFVRAGQFTMRNRSQLDVGTATDVTGGQINIAVNQLSLESGSVMTNSTFGSAQGGDTTITATESVSVSGENPTNPFNVSFIATNTNSQEPNAGAAGRLTINSPVVQLSDGGLLGARSAGTGDAGQIYIEADQVSISGYNSTDAVSSAINASASNSGQGGSIEIVADSLEIRNSGAIISQIFAPSASPNIVDSATDPRYVATGQGGRIILRVSGLLHLYGEGGPARGGGSIISSSTNSVGDGGDINIQAGEIWLEDGGQIASSALHIGNSGQVEINVTGNITIEGDALINSAQFPSSVLSITTGSNLTANETVAGLGGNSGNINLTAQTVTLRDGGIISADTAIGQPGGNGRGGEVLIEAEQITISGEPSSRGQHVSGIYAGSFVRIADFPTAGDGGTVKITTGELNLQNGGLIGTESESMGRGGNIDIQADTLRLTGNSKITAESRATGDAGNIVVRTNGSFELNQGVIETAANVADGGNITITAPHYIYLENSQITTSVQSGVGQGGNINLEPEFIIQKSSPILARAFGGPGGNINIFTRSIYVFPPYGDSPIDASSALSEDGVITIQSPDGTLEEDVVVLVSDFVDASALLQSLCSVEAAQDPSSFVVLPREGAPNNQSDLLPSNPLLNQLPGLNVSAKQPTPAAQPLQVARAGNPLFMGLVAATAAGGRAEPQQGFWYECTRQAEES